jgi:hypothetical protein
MPEGQGRMCKAWGCSLPIAVQQEVRLQPGICTFLKGGTYVLEASKMWTGLQCSCLMQICEQILVQLLSYHTVEGFITAPFWALVCEVFS